MACCAFIAFLASQIYLLAVAPVRSLRGTPRTPAPSPGAWRLEVVSVTPDGVPSAQRKVGSGPDPRVPARTSRHGRFWLPFVTVGTIELALVLGGGQWFLVGSGRQQLANELERLGAIQTLGDLKDLCTPGRSRGNQWPP